MKSDIQIPESKGIKLGIIPLEDDVWDIYLVNENDNSIRNILIVTHAEKEGRNTSMLRYFLENMGEFSFIKFESIYGEVMDFDNIISISYYIGADIFEKEFRFTKASLGEHQRIPILNQEGFVLN